MDNLDLLLIRIEKAISDGNTEEAIANVTETRDLLGSVAAVLLGSMPKKAGKEDKGDLSTAVTGIRDDTTIDQIFSLLVARDNRPVTFQNMEEAGIDYRAARQCVYASARRRPAFERIKLGRLVAVKLKPEAFELLQKRYAPDVCDQPWSAHARPTHATEPIGIS